MTAMIEITRDEALALQLHTNKEVYQLFSDGTEGLINDSEEIRMAGDAIRYGIEGELFNTPYEEQ